jgi:hypothetical protein
VLEDIRAQVYMGTLAAQEQDREAAFEIEARQREAEMTARMRR